MIVPMPTVGFYRGRGLHRFQPESRVRENVIPALERIFRTDDVGDLLRHLRDYTAPPESRLLAAEKLLAPAEELEAGRRRAVVDVALVKALRAGLDNLLLADPERYGCIFHVSPPDAPQPPLRPAEFRVELIAAQRAAA